MKNSTPIQWEAEHVRGHQDRVSPVQALPRKAQLNVEMDRLAEAYWIHLVTKSETMPSPKSQAIMGEEWQLWNGDYKITHPHDKILYSIFQDPLTDMWWRREGHISAAAHEAIDYNVTEETMGGLTAPQRKYITKSASENYGIGTTLVEWKHQDDAACPRCSHQLETPAHVQRCDGYSANDIFTKSITKLEDFLTEEGTRPDLQDAIIQCIKKWRAGEDIRLKEYQDDIQQVIQQQHSIGWLDMMECLPAKGWQQLQRRYYNEQGMQKSSKRWITGVLRHLFHVGHKQWKHRCDIKANVTRPQENEHIELMHDEIEKQVIRGDEELLPGDKSILNYSILHLLQRSLAYKKGWLARIWAARQRAQRIAMKDDTIIVQSKEAERITYWMKLHKDRPKWTTRRLQKIIPDTVMEEAPAQDESYIGDGKYLEDSVREDVRWQDRGRQPNEQDARRMDQSEDTHQKEISNIFNCDNRRNGFEGPVLDFNTSCTHIVDRNP
jgi:hypothetical protein